MEAYSHTITAAILVTIILNLSVPLFDLFVNTQNGGTQSTTRRRPVKSVLSPRNDTRDICPGFHHNILTIGHAAVDRSSYRVG